MDPVSVITAALAAGALAGAQGTATEAVKDLYGGLRRLVKGRFAGRAAGEVVLEQHEAKPELWGGFWRQSWLRSTLVRMRSWSRRHNCADGSS